jgi:surface polysaccharide O-acyltransferase-like enzyme
MRIPSIDCLRVFAILAVLAIHSHCFQKCEDYAAWEIGAAVILNQASRFAVPSFFIISGYLLGRDVRRGRDPLTLALAAVRRLGALFVVWSVLFAMVDLTVDSLADTESFSVRDSLSGMVANVIWSPRIHLWFLPALLIGLLVTGMTCRLGPRLQIALASALYAFGLVGGAYSTLTGLDLGTFSRNGPFFSTLFVVLGYRLGSIDFAPSVRQALALIGLGVVVQTAELIYLTQFLGVSPFGIDYVVGTVPFGVGVVSLALSRPQFGSNSALSRIGPLVLGIYLLHLDMGKLLSGYNPVSGFLGQLVLIAVSFLASLMVMLLVVHCRWRLAYWLFALKTPTRDDSAQTQNRR